MKNYVFVFWISGVLIACSFIFAIISTIPGDIFCGICLGFWISLFLKACSIEDKKKRGRRDS